MYFEDLKKVDELPKYFNKCNEEDSSKKKPFQRDNRWVGDYQVLFMKITLEQEV